MNSTMESYIREAVLRSTNELDSYSTDANIREFFSQYDETQALGIVNNVKGITNEIYYREYENSDGDNITAELQEAVNHEGSDVILNNVSTGESTEAQLKATFSKNYVTDAMEEHPDIEFITTEEIASELGLESTGISNAELTRDVENYLESVGLEGLDKDTSEYIKSINEIEQEVNLADTSILDSIGDVTGVALTGGFFAVLNMVKNNPRKQKQVILAAVAIGVADGFIDVGTQSLESGFDINPLFVASMACLLADIGSRSKNNKLAKIGSSFSFGLSVTMNVVEIGSYVAIGNELIDLLTGVDLIEGVIEGLDWVDGIDFIDGIDIVDGLATFGVGILASRGVKKLMDNWNEDDRKEVQRLQKAIAAKEMFRKMLKTNVPVPLLFGPYNEIR